MAIRIVQLGTPRFAAEGLRIGTVRRPPRGVLREDYGHLNYYDLWLPELAPSAPLVSWALSKPWDDKRWTTYARKYVAEMRKPSPQRLIALLAAFSQETNFSVGCYCDNPSRCHRSLLRDLLAEQGAVIE
jgi:uncharacterized protein YeaO (DUF488 family)